MPEPKETTQTVFSEGIVRRLAGLQHQRLVQERRCLDQMKTWDFGAPQPKSTRWKLFTRWSGYQFRRARVVLARWIAGDEWPEED